MKKLFFTIALLLSATPFASADTIECADGTQIETEYTYTYVITNEDGQPEDRYGQVTLQLPYHLIQRAECRRNTALSFQWYLEEAQKPTKPANTKKRTLADLFPHYFGGKE